MSARVVEGDAGVAAWDQVHAEAMRDLRHADAFIVVAWPDLVGGTPEVVCSAKDGGASMLRDMLIKAAITLMDAYERDVADL